LQIKQKTIKPTSSSLITSEYYKKIWLTVQSGRVSYPTRFCLTHGQTSRKKSEAVKLRHPI